MRLAHVIGWLAGVAWLVGAAFLTHSFLLSVPVGVAISIVGYCLAESQSERERAAANADRERYNAYLRKAWAEGREPTDEEMPPVRLWDGGSMGWAALLFLVLIGIIIALAQMPDAQPEQPRQQIEYK